MDALTPQNDLLQRMIAAAGLRSQVTNANLANVNTPGYRRQVVEFEGLLQEALQRGGSAADELVPRVLEDNESPSRPDGNNVTTELENAVATENRVLMETLLTILQARFSLMQSAIVDGR